jgi:GMP synthase-like glutamine amidotransferase
MLLPPLRIAILECDTPLAGTRAKYGGYGGLFKALLTAGADALNDPNLSSEHGLSLTNWDVVKAQEYPPLEDIDAILISGSRYNSFDDTPWIVKLVEFTKQVLAQDRVRIIGVCFGHQIVGRAMGVKVGLSPGGWEASVIAIDLTKRGQEIFGRPALVHPLPTSFPQYRPMANSTQALHQMHRDAVFEYPPDVEELAYTQACKVQALYIAKRLITVQGHPEFDEEIVRELLTTRHELGIFDDETLAEAESRVDKYQDGVVVAQAFLRFLLE